MVWVLEVFLGLLLLGVGVLPESESPSSESSLVGMQFSQLPALFDPGVAMVSDPLIFNVNILLLLPYQRSPELVDDGW